MKKLKRYTVTLAILLLMLSVQAINAQPMATQPPLEEVLTKEKQSALTPDLMLDRLKEGNDRFVNNAMVNRDLLNQVKETSVGQFPGAVILTCIDSRVPVEKIFDKGIGDVFVARVAGNTVNADVLGSVEYGTAVAGSKLVVILGHEACGAVKASIDNAKLSYNADVLLSRIQPAITALDDYEGMKSSSNPHYVDQVIHKNVHMTKDKMLMDSPVLKNLLDEGEIMIVGAYYDLDTGKVTFLD